MSQNKDEKKSVEAKTPPTFSKYCKIPNHYNKDVEKEKAQAGLDDERLIWIAHEKIHGANFSITTDGQHFWPAKRGSYLGGNASHDFYGADKVVEFNKPFIKALWELIKKKYSSSDQLEINVYGELFGGIYPHKEVKATNSRKVQSGVYYCPDVRWFPFDIRIVGQGYIRNVDEQRKLLEEAGFPFLVPEVKRGTWKEIMQWDIEKESSRIPSLLGLPELDQNIWEGVVLRPVTDSHFMVKYKTQTFKEITGTKQIKVASDLPSEEILSWVQNLKDNYINHNRIDSVKSKEMPDIVYYKLASLVIDDAMEEANYQGNQKDKRQVRKMLIPFTISLIKQSSSQ